MGVDTGLGGPWILVVAGVWRIHMLYLYVLSMFYLYVLLMVWQFPETMRSPNLRFYPNWIPIGSHVADRERATLGPRTAGVAMSVNPRSRGTLVPLACWGQ